jgi:hypothetical protein
MVGFFNRPYPKQDEPIKGTITLNWLWVKTSATGEPARSVAVTLARRFNAGIEPWETISSRQRRLISKPLRRAQISSVASATRWPPLLHPALKGRAKVTSTLRVGHMQLD